MGGGGGVYDNDQHRKCDKLNNVDDIDVLPVKPVRYRGQMKAKHRTGREEILQFSADPADCCLQFSKSDRRRIVENKIVLEAFRTTKVESMHKKEKLTLNPGVLVKPCI